MVRVPHMPRRITIVTPARRGTRHGNRVTAERWAHILRSLGFRVAILDRWDGRACDMLVALHARKSHDSVMRFRQACPGRPLVVALTGTDLYHDLPRSRAAQESLRVADRVVVLQPAALAELGPTIARKTRVIYQSCVAPRPAPRRDFDVCVIGHLRPVKDPFRPAMAARLLPRSSKVRILHLGAAMNPAMARRARAEQQRNPRYHWLGDVSHAAVARTLARSRLMVLPSRMEGGANVLGEALVAGVPVLASAIAGSTGILGRDYSGYFPVGDTAALARLLHEAETNPAFY
jgi:putative glycosyltransferase (TIGR04348 family)